MALVLGIETSCDETAVGIVDGRKLLANVISSSVEQHVRFGGVVPEVASRAHLEAMQQVIKQALKDAGVSIKDIDAIAVTAGPGLIGALLVGVSSASALSLALEAQPTEKTTINATNIRDFIMYINLSLYPKLFNNNYTISLLD